MSRSEIIEKPHLQFYQIKFVDHLKLLTSQNSFYISYLLMQFDLSAFLVFISQLCLYPGCLTDQNIWSLTVLLKKQSWQECQDGEVRGREGRRWQTAECRTSDQSNKNQQS